MKKYLLVAAVLYLAATTGYKLDDASPKKTVDESIPAIPATKAAVNQTDSLTEFQDIKTAIIFLPR